MEKRLALQSCKNVRQTIYQKAVWYVYVPYAVRFYVWYCNVSVMISQRTATFVALIPLSPVTAILPTMKKVPLSASATTECYQGLSGQVTGDISRTISNVV